MIPTSTSAVEFAAVRCAARRMTSEGDALFMAHQMLKADPWSECNPNMPFKSRQRQAPEG